MSDNIHEWKMRSVYGVLAQVLTFVPGIGGTKIVNKSLDGTVYIQTIGNGTEMATVNIFCTREEVPAVNSAEADGTAVSVDYRGYRYVGYIESPPQWEAVKDGYYYRSTVTLLVEEMIAI